MKQIIDLIGRQIHNFILLLSLRLYVVTGTLLTILFLLSLLNDLEHQLVLQELVALEID